MTLPVRQEWFEATEAEPGVHSSRSRPHMR